MSTFNQKVQAVTDVLLSNARQHRLTNRQELAEDSAALLRKRGQRKNSNGQPVERYKLVEVLDQVAKNSKGGVLLPALVVHYQDSRPGRRFSDWAKSAGVSVDHKAAVRSVFDTYAHSYAKSLFVVNAPSIDGPSRDRDRWGTRRGSTPETEAVHPHDRDEGD